MGEHKGEACCQEHADENTGIAACGEESLHHRPPEIHKAPVDQPNERRAWRRWMSLDAKRQKKGSGSVAGRIVKRRCSSRSRILWCRKGNGSSIEVYCWSRREEGSCRRVVGPFGRREHMFGSIIRLFCGRGAVGRYVRFFKHQVDDPVACSPQANQEHKPADDEHMRRDPTKIGRAHV